MPWVLAAERLKPSMELMRLLLSRRERSNRLPEDSRCLESIPNDLPNGHDIEGENPGNRFIDLDVEKQTTSCRSSSVCFLLLDPEAAASFRWLVLAAMNARFRFFPEWHRQIAVHVPGSFREQNIPHCIQFICTHPRRGHVFIGDKNTSIFMDLFPW
jgi:hypothetical protein